jgi:hypothetical protein
VDDEYIQTETRKKWRKETIYTNGIDRGADYDNVKRDWN